MRAGETPPQGVRRTIESSGYRFSPRLSTAQTHPWAERRDVLYAIAKSGESRMRRGGAICSISPWAKISTKNCRGCGTTVLWCAPSERLRFRAKFQTRRKILGDRVKVPAFRTEVRAFLWSSLRLVMATGLVRCVEAGWAKAAAWLPQSKATLCIIRANILECGSMAAALQSWFIARQTIARSFAAARKWSDHTLRER